MPWVFVIVGYVEDTPLNRSHAVSFGWRGRCASFVCCGYNMFLHVACEAVSGGVVGCHVRVLRVGILLFVYFRFWLDAGVFNCGNDSVRGLLI